MQHSRDGGLVRFTLEEILPPPFDAVSPARFTVEGSYRYFVLTPSYIPPLSRYFSASTIAEPAKRPWDFRKALGSRTELSISLTDQHGDKEEAAREQLEHQIPRDFHMFGDLFSFEQCEHMKIDPKEPIFILRAQDILAVRTVLFWAEQLELNGGDSQRVAAARDSAIFMCLWGGPKKLPD